jgi:hypothetical protein
MDNRDTALYNELIKEYQNLTEKQTALRNAYGDTLRLSEDQLDRWYIQNLAIENRLSSILAREERK